MMFCKTCSIPMVGVMSFSKEKHEKFCRCPKCKQETKHQRLGDEELSFGEVLDQKRQKSRIK